MKKKGALEKIPGRRKSGRKRLFKKLPDRERVYGGTLSDGQFFYRDGFWWPGNKDQGGSHQE